MRGSECMATYDPGFWAEQGQRLLSYYFELFCYDIFVFFNRIGNTMLLNSNILNCLEFTS